MAENTVAGGGSGAKPDDAISIVQRGNLKALETTLRKQWRLGQNIVLCWSPDDKGMLVILVPHYFLGNYCAEGEASENELFVRDLISGKRRKSREELFDVAKRLGVPPTFIKLASPLANDDNVQHAVEELIKRYGLSFVNSRAVLLFDIAEFSLYTPFEQASQLNSLSYSLNSAYNKLLSKGIEVNFARTTTGDGYYVWNRDLAPFASQDLFNFLLLVLADNAAARAASKGNTVPLIRSAFHIGSHYELYQAEGVNPTVFSYIVGDVTIELARMVDAAKPGQVLLGDFEWSMPSRERSGVMLPVQVKTPGFVRSCNRGLAGLQGISLAGKPVDAIVCKLSGDDPKSGEQPTQITITDKHGLSHDAYNLEVEVALSDRVLSLGGAVEPGLLAAQPVHADQPLQHDVAQTSAPGHTDPLPPTEENPEPAAPEPAEPEAAAPEKARDANEVVDDLAEILRRHGPGSRKRNQ